MKCRLGCSQAFPIFPVILVVWAFIILPVAPLSAQKVDSDPTESFPKETNIQEGSSFLGYETAIRIALERHPLLKKSRERSMATQAMTEQAKSRYYPQIDAYAITTAGFVRPLSGFNIAGAQNKPLSYVQEAGFRADQIIYDFGRTAHRILADQAAEGAAKNSVLTHKALVILRVQQAYLQSQRQKRLADIMRGMVKVRKVIREQILTLHKNQLRSKLDLNLLDLELKNAEVQLIQAKNELHAAFAALNNAMGIQQGPMEYTLEEVNPSSVPGETDHLIHIALKYRPEMMTHRSQILEAAERINTANAQHFPTLISSGLWGVIHFSDAPLNQYAGAHPGFTQTWWGAVAALRIPIFEGFLIKNRVAEAREQKYKIEKQLLELSNQISAEVTDAYATRITAEQQILVEQEEVKAAKSALSLSQTRYRLGLASIMEFTSAATNVLGSMVRRSEADYAFMASDIALLYATGRGYSLY